jgi:adenine/guanine phosphoribosyltransferase-like PRPP-binding protein
VNIEKGGMTSHRIPLETNPTFCVFEHVYFARPDSLVNGKSVYRARERMGARLAQECPAVGDVVVPVPDSGVPAGIGYSKESGIPFEMGLIRSHYVGRTFIEPQDSIRHFGVRLKLSPVRSVVDGKRVIVVDDSLVRGTTSRKIVKMLRNAGAREVHLRISAPPTTHPCFYGIDTPNRAELVAASHPWKKSAVRDVRFDHTSRRGMMASVGGDGRGILLGVLHRQLRMRWAGRRQSAAAAPPPATGPSAPERPAPIVGLRRKSRSRGWCSVRQPPRPREPRSAKSRCAAKWLTGNRAGDRRRPSPRRLRLAAPGRPSREPQKVATVAPPWRIVWGARRARVTARRQRRRFRSPALPSRVAR